jgi:hypothetical protein
MYKKVQKTIYCNFALAEPYCESFMDFCLAILERSWKGERIPLK